jgi:endonuclease YncB( thermonuclease family)
MQKPPMFSVKAYSRLILNLTAWMATLWKKDKIVRLSIPGLYLAYYFLPLEYVLAGATLVTFYIFIRLNSHRILAGSNLLMLSVLFLGMPGVANYVFAQVKTNLIRPDQHQTSPTPKSKLDFTQPVPLEIKINQNLGQNSLTPSNDLDQVQATLQSIDWSKENYFTVNEVYSGDTVHLQGLGVVNLLGIVAPAIPPDTSNFRLSCQYKQSLQSLKNKVLNQKVGLKFDPTVGQLDHHGRILALLKLQSGVFVNQEQVKDGQARLADYVVAEPFQTDLWETQLFAQHKELGLWNTKTCNPKNNTRSAVNLAQSGPVQQQIPASTTPDQTQHPNPNLNPTDQEAGQDFTTPSKSIRTEYINKPTPDFDAYDKVANDQNKDDKITCDDLNGPTGDPTILNKYPSLLRDKNNLSCAHLNSPEPDGLAETTPEVTPSSKVSPP